MYCHRLCGATVMFSAVWRMGLKDVGVVLRMTDNIVLDSFIYYLSEYILYLFTSFVSLCREFRPMEDVNFHDNGTKVSAVNNKIYVFVRNMSRGPESDLIRTVNIPAMVSQRHL